MSPTSFRLGCPISSLPINRLRQLSTPAHAFALLHLPPAAQSNAANCSTPRYRFASTLQYCITQRLLCQGCFCRPFPAGFSMLPFSPPQSSYFFTFFLFFRQISTNFAGSIQYNLLYLFRDTISSRKINLVKYPLTSTQISTKIEVCTILVPGRVHLYRRKT